MLGKINWWKLAFFLLLVQFLATIDELASSSRPIQGIHGKEALAEFGHQSHKLHTGVSVVTAVHNRWEALNDSLPSWYSPPVGSQVNEIVVVDWSSSSSSSSSLSFSSLKSLILSQQRRLAHPIPIILIEVTGENNWALARAFNVGLRAARFTTILKLDVEVQLRRTFFTHHPWNLKQKFYTGNHLAARNENEMHLNGIVFAPHRALRIVGGYDERLNAYGWDDSNLYDRLELAGFQRRTLNLDQLHHVEHSDQTRSRGDGLFCPVCLTEENRIGLSYLPKWSKSSKHSRYKVLLNEPPLHMRIQAAWKPLPMKALLSPDQTRAVQLEARQIYLHRITSLDAFQTNYIPVLETMIRVYDMWRPGSVFIFESEGPFSLRLWGLAFAQVMARRCGHQHFILVWPEDRKNAIASFHRLFEIDRFGEPFVLLDKFHPVLLDNHLFAVWNVNERPADIKHCAKTNKNVYLKSDAILTSVGENSATKRLVWEQIRSLTPRSEVIRFVSQALMGMPPNCVAVHLVQHHENNTELIFSDHLEQFNGTTASRYYFSLESMLQLAHRSKKSSNNIDFPFHLPFSTVVDGNYSNIDSKQLLELADLIILSSCKEFIYNNVSDVKTQVILAMKGMA